MIRKYFRKSINRLEKKIIYLIKLKTTFSEYLAILRKLKLIKNIQWTSEQQIAFDNYWIENYGKKIKPYWHKLYEKCSGVFNIEYLPEYLYSTKIEFQLNPFKKSQVLADKSLTEILYSKFVLVPSTYGLNSDGIYYGTNRKVISESHLILELKNCGICIIKPTVGSSSGKSIQLLDIRNGVDVNTNRSILDIFRKFEKNFIIQERINQNYELSTIYPYSLNTLRIITFISEESIQTGPITLRMGTDGKIVDNIHAGGLAIYVNDVGELSPKAYRLGYGDNTISYGMHPDTGIVFRGYKLSFIPKLIEKAKALHSYTPGLGIISWDFAYDMNSNIVLIESNTLGQSVWFPQMISGIPLFKDKTKQMLAVISP